MNYQHYRRLNNVAHHHRREPQISFATAANVMGY